MKTAMKKLGVAMLLVALTVATAQATGKKMKLKKHHCTSACVNGKHMYAHGEKGHVCTDACKKM